MAGLRGSIATIGEAAEIPQAFSTGVVDAMVTSGATGLRTKAWDFSTSYSDLTAWLPKNMIFVNKRASRGAPDAQRVAEQKASPPGKVRGLDLGREDAEPRREELVCTRRQRA